MTDVSTAWRSTLPGSADSYRVERVLRLGHFARFDNKFAQW
jgi:hypothetical protein